VNELKHVTNFFKWDSGFDTLGHPWGSMLGVEYALAHLLVLELSDLLVAMPLWAQSQIQLLSAFPTVVQEG